MAGLLYRWPQRLELSKSEARHQEFLPCLLHSCRGPRTWAILPCFSGQRKEQGQKCSTGTQLFEPPIFAS